MVRKARIRNRWIVINRLFIILIVMMVSFTIIREITMYSKMNTHYEDNLYVYRSNQLEQEVLNRIDEINQIESKIESEFREALIHQISLLDYFASETVANIPGTPTLEEKRDVYIETVYQYDVSEEGYLFFLIDTDGIARLLGLDKSDELNSLIDLQDATTGSYFVREMIDVVQESESNGGFVTYSWPKELGGDPIEKTSYVYYNAEIDLIIGTGEYMDDYRMDVQEEFLENISAYYSDSEDYIFVIGFEGTVLEHGSPDFTSEDLLKIKTTDDKILHDSVVDGLQNDSSLWLNYYGPDNDLQIVEKRGYFAQIEGWNMYIGQALYIDDIELVTQSYMKETMFGLVITILSKALILTGFVLFIKKVINDNFRDVQEEFNDQSDMIAEYALKDSLTGLYNRKYFERAFLKLQKSTAISYSIVQGDANGLKLTNDAFGHEAGDNLLIFIASTLNELFPDDHVFRWGGDEFLVLSHITDETIIKEKLHQFTIEADKDTTNKVNASVSFGYQITSIRNDPYIEMKAAEKMMYERKTLESSSTKRKIIDNILKTLYDSISFEERHSNNVMENALLIGEALGFDSVELGKLRLSALMHDIGKIGIPDKIIQKPGQLTDDEYDEIKQHSEKGFRILSAYPELSEYGYIVLHHHERYDGTGYPRKLKGADIPLHSRIITVADAFDAMVQERVYKEKFSTKQALSELSRNRGTQFDPLIVDTFISSTKFK